MMNTRSLKLIREVIINSGKWTSIEIAQDSIYIEFKDVELGNPKHDEEMALAGMLIFYQNMIITTICLVKRYCSMSRKSNSSILNI